MSTDETAGRRVTRTCLVRGREAQGRMALVVSRRDNSRVADHSDGKMMAASRLVPTAEVYDIQPFQLEPKCRIHGVVGKRGVTTLPLEYRRLLGLNPDDPIIFELQGRSIVIHPARIDLRDGLAVANLDDLLAGVTPENIHPEVDFGPPVGREVL